MGHELCSKAVSLVNQSSLVDPFSTRHSLVLCLFRSNRVIFTHDT